jgi:hypothetical protein
MLLFQSSDSGLSDTTVQGHKVDAFFGLLLNYGENSIRGHVYYCPMPFDGFNSSLVYGHSAYGNIACGDDGMADGLYIASGAQVHNCISTKFDGYAQFI